MNVALVVRDAAGKEVARNVYRDPFHPQRHPRGHPGRIDNELGMRHWWAGTGR